MGMDAGYRDDVDYGDLFSIPIPAASHMLNLSIHQLPLQCFPSNGFHRPHADSYPSPASMFGCTPSPASTTTEVENSEDLFEATSDDAVLAYINRFLLEDEDFDSCHGIATSVEDSALLTVEKPFVDILAAANPTEACQENSWTDCSCDVTGNGGSLDMFLSTRTSCQLVPCELEVEKGECTLHKGWKRPNDDYLELEEERRKKQLAVSEEESLREMFDNVLLCNGPTCELRDPLPAEGYTCRAYVKGSGNRRGRKKGKSGAVAEDDAVDLTTLLIHCAQATAIDDHRSSNELLKQIRQRSSVHGDAGQRLAHCFANGLEARLAGTGSTIYRSLSAKRISATDILKAFELYVTACPFKKISNFFSNQTILNASKGVTRLHIIDYGIQYGFQWPIFFQWLSKRSGGFPSIRITGIDLPQPGFRPAECIEATGRRLHEYARMFNVPFEYHAIAAKWDTIRIEDLKIDRDELLVVNCLFRMRNMMDETVTDESPRMHVLNTIRKMNPHLFIHGVVNGTYNAPFFVTRFKEALFHFSSLFDMLESTASRLDENRLLIEREIFGREALNVIACEGTDRVERPETYKQWQLRMLRAGFKQLPLNQETVTKARYKVSKSYHRDFLVDEDNKWMLQGWKGRVVFALSTWEPN
ncbi:hypothetical protein GUJ93_ZPchr0013g36555 [Zizania palustris]|uniref:Scarecrow-like protein 9 n=1 Tax=Zizania palustris TaxID=103762 RepID=A0A8J5WZE3_ZIZPA|nr:hypothetical protein GUJ93_ZPchr0013g36555 [Zizania palustris]